MSNTRVIGIDFGTSTSVVRVKRYDENNKPLVDRLTTQAVVFNMGSTMVPTLIRTCDNGGVYFGYDAEGNKRNTTLHQNFKVDLESTDPSKKAQARELTEAFFEYLGKVYKEQRDNGHLGSLDDIEKTYISYPVKWSEDAKKFMVESAKKAGFVNVEGIDEAQAAIQAVLTQNEDHINKKGFVGASGSLNILLLDMGAGTTDLVLCKYMPQNKKTDILCTWPKDGSILFGGKEVDEVLRQYIEPLLPEEVAPLIMKRCGVEKFKAWKETVVSPMLSNKETVTEFSELDNMLELMDAEMDGISLDRGTFEKMGNAYLRKLPRLVNGCIKASGISAANIDLVILTGGHSQWYFTKEMLSGKLNNLGELSLTKIKNDPARILTISLPQETVAMGLVFRPLKMNLINAVPQEEMRTPLEGQTPSFGQKTDKAEQSVQKKPATQQENQAGKIPPELEKQRKMIEKYRDMEYTRLHNLSMSEQLASSAVEYGCVIYALALREKEMKISSWLHSMELAAYKGIADAQAALGAAYMYEEGMPEDNEKICFYLKNAGKQGVGEAYENLGIHYLINEKYDQALDVFRKAKTLGESEDNLLLKTEIRKCISEADFYTPIAYPNGFNVEVTQVALRKIAEGLSENYDELRRECLFGASESDFWGEVNAVFLTDHGIYTCVKGGEYIGYQPWRQIAKMSFYKNFYASLSMRENIYCLDNGRNYTIVPYVSNGTAVMENMTKLQKRLANVFGRYKHLF